MTRLESIYVMAVDVVDEHFQNEMAKVIETKSNKEFMSLVNAVYHRMMEDGKITKVDVDTFFDLVYHNVAKAVNDMLMVKQTCVSAVGAEAEPEENE
jgi:hypothetical protein